MRVLIDDRIPFNNSHGGIARMYRELLPRITQHFPEIRFYVSCNDFGGHQIPAASNIVILPIRILRPARIFAYINRMIEKRYSLSLAQLGVDVFLSTYYTQNPFPYAKTISPVYDLIDHEFPLFMPNGAGFSEIQRAALERADHIVAISQSTLDHARAAFSLKGKDASILYLDAAPMFKPADRNHAASFRKRFTGNKQYMLAFGGELGYKNLGNLLRGYASIRNKIDAVLLLVGHATGYMPRYVFDLAIQLGIEKSVFRLVDISDDLLREAYSHAVAFVFPSLQEGFGIPLVEAMRCGAPILASDIAVFHEICGDSVLYFDPRNPESIADTMLRVTGKAQRDVLINSGYVRSRSFSWDRSAHQMGQLIVNLAENRPSTR